MNIIVCVVSLLKTMKTAYLCNVWLSLHIAYVIMLFQFERKFIHIKNSLYVGQSSSFNCSHDLFRSADPVQEIASTSSPFYNGGRFSYNGRPYGSGKVGIVWPTFISKNIGTPVKPFRYTKTFPAFYGETFISGKRCRLSFHRHCVCCRDG